MNHINILNHFFTARLSRNNSSVPSYVSQTMDATPYNNIQQLNRLKSMNQNYKSKYKNTKSTQVHLPIHIRISIDGDVYEAICENRVLAWISTFNSSILVAIFLKLCDFGAGVLFFKYTNTTQGLCMGIVLHIYYYELCCLLKVVAEKYR